MLRFTFVAVSCFLSFLIIPLQSTTVSSNDHITANAENANEAMPEIPVLYAKTGPFERNTVIQLARELSKKPYVEPKNTLPPNLLNPEYDEYKKIRFKPASALWKEEGLPFQLQLFHGGLLFKNKVEIATVEGNRATYIPYNRSNFTTGDGISDNLPLHDIGYSGFRIHFPLNTPDYHDELIAFQGATYFRALGKGNTYGISARGLAINTAEPKGEEFPDFVAFWIEKPAKESDSIVVHALMDSPSVAGAYRFTIRPGANTVTDVEVQLFPRVDLANAGLAPMTSMYMFSMNGRLHIDDYRPQVHDSDALLMFNGRDERLLRPLKNPENLQVSTFIDQSPVGFGLMQRERSFKSYEDLEAHYERRPSLWAEPLGSWGEGSVELIEIPTPSEIHDNIITSWRPSNTIKAGSEYTYSYRLIWGDHPDPREQTISAMRTASGRSNILKPTPNRLYVIDYEINGDKPEKIPQPKVTASQGEVKNVVIRDNPINHGYRLSFEFDPLKDKVSELRAELKTEGNSRADVWLFRYTE